MRSNRVFQEVLAQRHSRNGLSSWTHECCFEVGYVGGGLGNLDRDNNLLSFCFGGEYPTGINHWTKR